MRQDQDKDVVLNDHIIILFGELLLKKYGPAKKSDINQRMRQVARLLRECWQIMKVKHIDYSNLLCGGYFDHIIKATESLCGLYDSPDGRRQFKNPRSALSLPSL